MKLSQNKLIGRDDDILSENDDDILSAEYSLLRKGIRWIARVNTVWETTKCSRAF